MKEGFGKGTLWINSYHSYTISGHNAWHSGAYMARSLLAIQGVYCLMVE